MASEGGRKGRITLSEKKAWSIRSLSSLRGGGQSPMNPALLSLCLYTDPIRDGLNNFPLNLSPNGITEKGERGSSQIPRL
jgi:hypothetical protein